MRVFVKADMSAGMNRMGGPALIRDVNEGGEGGETTYIVKFTITMSRLVLKAVRKCEMAPQEEQATRPKRQRQTASKQQHTNPMHHEHNARPRAGFMYRRR